MFTDFTTPPNTITHPGRVTVVAPDGTETVQTADTLPQWVAFSRNREGSLVPVVLIARVKSGTGFTLRSYSADGRLVSVVTSPDGKPVAPPEQLSGWF